MVVVYYVVVNAKIHDHLGGDPQSHSNSTSLNCINLTSCHFSSIYL